MRELIVGLDVGSSSTKGVMVDRAGALLAAARDPIKLHIYTPVGRNRIRSAPGGIPVSR